MGYSGEDHPLHPVRVGGAQGEEGTISPPDQPPVLGAEEEMRLDRALKRSSLNGALSRVGFLVVVLERQVEEEVFLHQ